MPRLKHSALLASLGLLLAAGGSAQEAAPELRFDITAIDKSADPCSDFYQYACGGWLAKNPIPPDRSAWAVYQQMRALNQRRVAEILERAAEARPGRSSSDQRIGDYYASCLDEPTIERNDLGPLRPELERVDAIRSREALAEAIAHLQALGGAAGLSISADQRLDDATAVIAYLDESGLSLPDANDYTSEDADRVDTRARYRAHLQEVFALTGRSASEAAASAANVLAIETTLARASLTPLERRDRRAWYHVMTFPELRQLAPSVPWQRYFAAAGLDPRGELNVAAPRYVQALDGLFAGTSMAAWRDYLRFQLVRLATPLLPARFRGASFSFFSRDLRDVKQEASRAEQCAGLANRDLGEAVGASYVRLYFPVASRERVLQLVARLRAAMEQDFEELAWLGPGTRREALRKLSMLRVMIGHPDAWRDYTPLRIARGDALGNAFRAQSFEFRRQLAKIGRPVAREEFYELPQSVEGYHDNPLNVVAFTAGILQPPFFDPRVDDAVSYGLAGGVIGHELTHAFDDKGHLFDGAGNMRDWWSSEDGKQYDERAACFVKQYSAYTAVGEVKVDGRLTLGENIADNGGLQLAYRAFASEPRAGAPVDGLSPEQRFFLGWAQWRCTNVTPKAAGIWARTDAHSPGRWRVNGVVSNMPAFARAYACKAGDAMVNPEPCRIW